MTRMMFEYSTFEEDSKSAQSAENDVVAAVKLELWDEVEVGIDAVLEVEVEVELDSELDDVVLALKVENVVSVVVVVVEDDLDFVVEDLIFGHKAAMIPPPLTIPNNVLEPTLSFEQALLTHVAFAVKADWQSREHPSLKSDNLQTEIEVLYSTKQPNETAVGETN
ncbi:hypothetical protein ACHAPF_008809 [Botrytis cinerea]